MLERLRAFLRTLLTEPELLEETPAAEPVLVVVEPILHLQLTVVYLGASDTVGPRTAWTSLRVLQDWFMQEFNVAIYIGRVKNDVRQFQDSSLRYVFEEGYTYPTLFLVSAARLSSTNIGLAQGEFASVAAKHELWVEAAKHELGHLLGLRHNEVSFMHPLIEQGHLLPVLPGERATVRRYVERYCR